MNLENSRLSERRQTQKAASRVTSFTWTAQRRRVPGESRQTRAGGGEAGARLLRGSRFVFGVIAEGLAVCFRGDRKV